MRFVPGNAQHVGARQSQQDAFGFGDPDDAAFVAHGGFLAVVCDGMGGMEHGEAASRAAVRAFLSAYVKKTFDESIPDALERSLHTANREVLEIAGQLGAVEGMGTTLVAAVIEDLSLYFISVGDSGLFHVHGGELRVVNRPHVFANYLEQAVARGEIPLEAALNHPERDSLTSYIGAATVDEIDRNLEPWPIAEGDTILLASDGMFKTLSSEEIAEALQGDPAAWPDTLVERTLAKGREYQDNVTVLSVTLAPVSTDEFPASAVYAAPRRKAPPLLEADMLPPPLPTLDEGPPPLPEDAVPAEGWPKPER
jgi:protein phosphatase